MSEEDLPRGDRRFDLFFSSQQFSSDFMWRKEN